MTPSPDHRIPRPADDSNLTWDVIAVLWENVDFYQDAATLSRSLEGTTPGQRAVYACTWYLSEVLNGGHDQFFSNSTGALWPETLAGLELLGATEHRQVLQEAIALFGSTPPPRDQDRRCRQLLDIPGEKPFKALDATLYTLEKRTSLDEAFRTYILAHPAEFFR